ncbi:MAG: hypothetical protein ACK4YP_19820, partial [Myxococcota bacterium]
MLTLVSWLPLLVVPLLLRVALRAPAEEPWRARVDVPLALAAGVATALVGGLWLVRFELLNHPLTASDFGQYCVGVDILRGEGGSRWPGQRSVAAGWLPGLLAGRLGILDALVVAAFVSFAATGAGVYVWAHTIGEQLGTVCAALALGTVGQIVVLTRTVTFYPATIAAFVLASAGAAAAVRWRTVPALLLAGIGAGAALLIDVRGLLWGLPTIAVGLVAAAIGPPGGAKGPFSGPPALLVALLAPVGAAWLLGPWAFPSGTIALEQQVANWAADAARYAGATEPVDVPTGGFVWGTSDLRALPTTIHWLATVSDRLPAEVAADPVLARLRAALGRHWLFPGLGALAVVAATVGRRRPVALLALLVGAAPFLVALRGAVTVLGHPRYVATGLLVLPLLLGLAFEALATARLAPDAAPMRPRSEALRLGVGVTAFVLLLLGVVPSWLSPASKWRMRVPADTEPTATLAVVAGEAAPSPAIDGACVTALRRDLDSGRGPTLFQA